MSARYRLNLKNIKQIGELAREKLCELIILDTKRYVPNSGGRLERSAHTRNNSRLIVYSTPYAQYLWHGKLMLAPNGSSWARRGEKKHLTDVDLKYNTSINHKAGKYWVARAKADRIDKWVKELKDELKYELRSSYGIHRA